MYECPPELFDYIWQVARANAKAIETDRAAQQVPRSLQLLQVSKDYRMLLVHPIIIERFTVLNYARSEEVDNALKPIVVRDCKLSNEDFEL